MKNFSYDLIIIGGGPAGIEAAETAAAAGLNTALVSATKIGGRAIWSSLLPSKLWVHAAEDFSGNDGEQLLNLSEMKRQIASASTKYSAEKETGLKNSGINLFPGSGQITDEHSVEVKSENGIQIIRGKIILVASGSGPHFFGNVKPNGDRIIAPRLMTNLQIFPKSIIMVGGGVTGCEYASVFNQLGARVTLVTDLPALLPGMDLEIQNEIVRLFRSGGIEVVPESPVKKVEQTGGSVEVVLKSGENLSAEFAFLALGRKADLSPFSAASHLVHITESGSVEVNEFGQTRTKNIFAAGDVAGTPMTANKARYMARTAVHVISGKKPDPLNYNLLTNPVYTKPQIARVGLPENELKTLGVNYKVYKFNFSDALKSIIENAPEGFIKILADSSTDLILGSSVIGSQASELINIILTAMKAGLPVSRLRELPFSYPSFAELFLEADN